MLAQLCLVRALFWLYMADLLHPQMVEIRGEETSYLMNLIQTVIPSMKASLL